MYIKWKDERKVFFHNWHGFKYQTSYKIDGGCLRYHHAMVNAVKKLKPNKTWNHGIDFGCGDGGVGLAFQGEKLVKDFTYVDHFEPATKGCLENLKLNNLKSKVITEGDIRSMKIKNADFLFMNPPHHRTCELMKMYSLGWIKEKSFDKNEIPWKHFDIHWNFHKHFYTWIPMLLADQADLFIWENGRQTSPLIWEWGKLAPKLKKETWVDFTDDPQLDFYYVIHLSFNRNITRK